MKDPYELLNVSRDVTEKELKSSYRKLAKKYHPDLHPNDKECEQKFKEIGEAYQILSDPEKRKLYDTYGSKAFENGASGFNDAGFAGFGGFGDIFGDIFDIFSQSANAYSKNSSIRGEDLQQYLNLTFKEAVFGVKKSFKVRRKVECDVCNATGAKPGTSKKTCSKCHGTGSVQYEQNTPFGRIIRNAACDNCDGTGEIIEEKCENCNGTGFEYKNETINVDIPKGVENNSIIKLRGLGNCGENGGSYGDLYLILQVEDHPVFKRENLDIYFEMPITFVQAALGDTIEIPTLKGKKEFDIPEATQTGERFILKGEGIENERTGRVGNLYFFVKVMTPKNLNEQQKDKLREFAKISGKEVKEHKKNFFEKLKDLFE